jgi:hypothetical protein
METIRKMIETEVGDVDSAKVEAVSGSGGSDRGASDYSGDLHSKFLMTLDPAIVLLSIERVYTYTMFTSW